MENRLGGVALEEKNEEGRMNRRFNITGTCIPEKHFMADTSGKIDRIIRLIEQDSYFTINRARQYGTTTLMLLWKRLKEQYIMINTSFEGEMKRCVYWLLKMTFRFPVE